MNPQQYFVCLGMTNCLCFDTFWQFLKDPSLLFHKLAAKMQFLHSPRQTRLFIDHVNADSQVPVFLQNLKTRLIRPATPLSTLLLTSSQDLK